MTQPHFELVASAKALTELATLDAATLTAPAWVSEGLETRAVTALSNEATDDLTALASGANSLLT